MVGVGAVMALAGCGDKDVSEIRGRSDCIVVEERDAGLVSDWRALGVYCKVDVPTTSTTAA